MGRQHALHGGGNIGGATPYPQGVTAYAVALQGVARRRMKLGTAVTLF